MKKGVFKRFVSGLLTAMVCLVGIPAIPDAHAADQQQTGNIDGYDYELWNQNYQGTASMDVGSNGSFTCSWSGIENCLFRTGKKLGSTKKYSDYNGMYIDYDVDYEPKGNSYMCIYGWTEDPTVEYYIVEAWGSWRPPGATSSLGTVEANGHKYDIYKTTRVNQPSIHGTETFDQYWSVRQDNPAQNNVKKNITGRISVSKHFDAWSKAGLNMGGKMYEVALNIEGYQSSGSANVKKNGLVIGEGDGDGGSVVTPIEPVEPDKNGYYFNIGFENGEDDFTPRGDTTLSVDSKNYLTGSKSQKVTGRADTWQGTAIALDPNAFIPGNSYSFGVGILQNSGKTGEAKLTLQYTDTSGDEQYDTVASADAQSGKWTWLENTSYTIPAGATNMLLYAETDSTDDFFIDDAYGAVKGTVSDASKASGVVEGGSVTTTTTTTSKGDTNTTVTTSSQNVDPANAGLKDIFSKYFRFGSAVSANEVNKASDFIVKHFNSITPENELKPDALLDQAASQSQGNNVDPQVKLPSGARTILDFAAKNNIPVRGHTLVWHSQTPDWFFRENFSGSGAYVSKDVMDQRMENYIKNVFALLEKEYPTVNFYAYDVVNEAFENDGNGLRPAGSNSGGGESAWMLIYGDDSFITKAFTYARKYAPAGTKLFYNDYNEYIPAKRDNIYNLAKKLQADGLIDGIGMQSHLDTGYPDAKTYQAAIEKFASLGLEVQVTELDVTCSDTSVQASYYKDIFKTIMDCDAVSSVTVWGTNDSMSWRGSQNPLLFDGSYNAKPAYDAIVSLVDQSDIGKGDDDTPDTKWGDANCDGVVDLSDAVLIMQYSANPDEYGIGKLHGITEQGAANADVYENGSGLTNSDALSIQKYKLGLIDKLPESYAAGNTPDDDPITTNDTANSASFNSTFETGADSWSGRGDATISVDKDSFYSGSGSLKVTGRTDAWNGAAYSLSDFKAGNTYSFSAAVMQASGSAVDMKLTLQYTDSSGDEQYDTIAEETVSDKTWTKIENTSYTIPSGASDLLLYVETADSLTDFYIDDAAGGKEGTKSKVVTGSGTVGTTASNSNQSAPVEGVDISWIDPNKPMVAICFDDGAKSADPSSSSMRIINAIADSGFHSTFFYVGNWINSNNEAEVKYASQKGMEIANHSTTHPDLTTKSASEIRSEYETTQNKLRSIIGKEPSAMMRLPYLACNSTVQSTLNDVALITCSIDTGDWNNASTNDIINKITSAMANGSLDNAIVLCHETYDTTAEAMEYLAPYLKQQGWQIVTVSELFAVNGKTLNGGTVYTQCK